MALPPGRTLGPYRIVSLLGAGGMGEVYRAEDPKLERQVALKVLPPHPGGDPVPLERFEREAKAVAALSHPNILGIFDFGRDGALAYAAMELLEGETLRQRLKGGALPPRRAVELALQMAQGLAAAHDKGILHRDLKPENLFITTEGRLKILDFGLATRMPVGFRFQETLPRGGLPNPEGGTFFGTVGYVSPEQAKGEPMDGRSEVFAFGVVLFEMLGGHRPFEKESAPQTLAAIIEEDPPELRPPKGPVPVSLERIVLHCLEKRPELRFQSMRDLAFDLENLAFASEAGREAPRGRAARKVPWGLAGGILVGAGLALGAWWLGGRGPEPPAFRRVTFRQGFIRCARFMPDGGGFLYSATWGEDPPRLYSSRMESLEDRPMDLPGAHLQALSPAGEMALQLRVEGPFGWVYRGALARASLGGSAPKEVAEGVEWADWSPDGRLAIVRTIGGEGRLEFPMGEIRARTPGWISHPRFSPRGGAIAFIEHPIPGYSRGLVKVVDLDSGRIRDLSGGYSSAEGLAWRGEEVWFTGAEAGSNRTLYAVSPSARRRLVLRMPGSLHLYDIGPGGRVLLGLEEARTGILWMGEDGVRDLSWRTWSLLRGLSADGRRILFDEEGDSSGPDYDIYLRGTDGSPAMHVGQGSPAALGPDGAWVAAIQHRPAPHLVLLPTGPGEPRHLPALGIAAFRGNLAFMPDGQRLVFSANEAEKGPRVYIQDVEGGTLRPLTAEHQTPLLGERFLSPEGRRLLVRDRGEAPLLLDLSSGEATARPLRGMEAGERVLHWDAGGRALYVYRPGPFPAQAWKVELDTGRRSLWRRLDPPGHPGDVLSHSALATPDGRTLALIYRRQRTVLYEASGLR